MNSRCSICPGTKRCVEGDGPRPARVMCIGEAPGREEDYGGRPFIGQAGREFNENYLKLAGLDRDEVYITNTVKCRPDQNRKPNEKEVARCSQHHLPGELREVQPEVVVLMGATACSLARDIDLESEHGIPRRGYLFGWEGWIIPMYHPAAGLHDGAMMTPLLEDWERLRGWLWDGVWQWPIDSIQSRDYALATHSYDIDDYLNSTIFPIDWIGIDTETQDKQQPFSIQFSAEVGTGRMLLLDDIHLARYAADRLKSYRYVLHNAPADLDMMEWSGFRITEYRDTMQEAYHFGNLRQGLKPLSRRLLGRKRKSWDETVTPPSKDALCQWMCEGFVLAESEWRTTVPRYHKKTGKPILPAVTRSVSESLLLELMGYMRSNPEYDVWSKLAERMPVDEMERLVNRLGRPPAKGIAHCSLDDAVYYGCSDADDTLALALLFDRMRQEFKEGLNVQNEDIDVPRQRQSIQTHSYSDNHALRAIL